MIIRLIRLLTIIVEVSDEQDHGGSRLLAVIDQVSTAPESEILAENNKRKETH